MSELTALAGLRSLASRLGVNPLTVQQERAITLIMRGQSYAAVAEDVGCSPSTVTNWMSEGHAFRRMHDFMRDERSAWTMADARVDRNLLTGMLFEAHRKAATATEEIAAIRELGKMHGLYESDKKAPGQTVVVNVNSTDQLRRLPTEKLLELIGAGTQDLVPVAPTYEHEPEGADDAQATGD